MGGNAKGSSRLCKAEGRPLSMSKHECIRIGLMFFERADSLYTLTKASDKVKPHRLGSHGLS